MVKKPPITLVEPGTMLACFTVPGRAVPWKAPSTTRTGHSYKDPKLVSWQNYVWVRALQAMMGKPYKGPVYLHIKAFIKRQRGAAPDITNIVKAIEDALQNAVIVNDRQTVAIHARRAWDDNERVVITVEAA